MKSSHFFKVLTHELKSRLKQETNGFKIRAFKNVLNQIESEYTEKEIYGISDLKEYDIKGIGKGIENIINDVISEKIKMNVSKDEISIDIFMNIMSVGIQKAKQLVANNIYSIQELKEAITKDPKLLNEKQKLGLKYYEDFKLRIPRDEMKFHDAIIGQNIKDITGLKYNIVGSYRRGLSSSGDIDIILCMDNDELILDKVVNKLKNINYLVDDFAKGDKKYMGSCKICDTYRRIDILFVTSDKYPFALTYFTGSKEFNIKMRKLALKQGYSLNEFGLKDKNKNYINSKIKSEKDLFKFLGMDYVDPIDR